MVFWIVSAVITAVVAAALVAPLFRKRIDVVDESASEIAIYRDQLGEIDRDLERGVLPQSEAETARTEIARRLLRASERVAALQEGSGTRQRVALWIALLVTPIVAVGGYLALGEPGAEDRPIAEREASPDPDDLFAQYQALPDDPSPEVLADLSDRVDAALLAQPRNAGLLELAAIMRLQTGQIEPAAEAYLQFISLFEDAAEADPGGEFGVTLSVFLMQRDVSPALLSDLIRTVADRFPGNALAEINLARLLSLEGDNEAAAGILLEVLEDEPPGGSTFFDLVRDLLFDLGIDAPPPPEGAFGLTPEQLEFVEERVGQLAARLDEDPNDPEGWAQLITSYIVLGRNEEALASLSTAREFFTGNAEALAIIDGAAAPLVEQQ